MIKIKKSPSRGGVSFIGTRNLIDLDTGERFKVQKILKSAKDSDFKKIFIGDILEKIDVRTVAKLKFIIWLVDNASKENRVIGTLEQLAKKSGVSYATAARLIPLLKNAGIVITEVQSTYMLNTDITESVSNNKSNALLVQYCNLNS